MNQIVNFLKEVNIELSRVQWPNTEEFINSTIITLILVVFFAAYFFVIDQILQHIITYILY